MLNGSDDVADRHRLQSVLYHSVTLQLAYFPLLFAAGINPMSDRLKVPSFPCIPILMHKQFILVL